MTGYPNPSHENWETIMLEFIQRLTRRDEETGASAVEYGLLVAAIAALIVLIVFALGGVVKEVFTDTCSPSRRARARPPPAPAADADAFGVGRRLLHPRTRLQPHVAPLKAAAMALAERDERGASATEYGLLVVAIAALIVIIVFALGGRS